MYRIFLIILILIHTDVLYAQIVIGSNFYHYKINLQNEERQGYVVVLHPPMLKEKVVMYKMESNNQFEIDRMEAKSIEGKKIYIKKMDETTWQINDANSLLSLHYILKPRSMISKDYLYVNSSGFVGYFEGYDTLRYRIDFRLPAPWYGNSPMESYIEDDEQIFHTDGYDAIRNIPIIFAEPDTSSIVVNNHRMNITCFFKDKKKASINIAEYILNETKTMYQYVKEYVHYPGRNWLVLVDDNFEKNRVINNNDFTLLQYKMGKIDSISNAIAAAIQDSMMQSLRTKCHQWNEKSQLDWVYDFAPYYIENKIKEKNLYKTEKEYIDHLHNEIAQYQLLNNKQQDIYKTNSEWNLINSIKVRYLDYILRFHSNNSFDWSAYLLELHKLSQKNKYVEDKDIIYHIIRTSKISDAAEYLWRYMDGNDTIKHEEYVKLIGYDIIKQNPIRKYAIANISWQKGDSSEYLEVKNVEHPITQDELLQVGDRVLQINELKCTSDNILEIEKILTTSKENDRIVLQIMRNVNNQYIPITLSMKTDLMLVEMPWKLEVSKNASKKEKELLKAYMIE